MNARARPLLELPARDAEVQLEWLSGQYATLDRDERPGCRWLIRKFGGRECCSIGGSTGF